MCLGEGWKPYKQPNTILVHTDATIRGRENVECNGSTDCGEVCLGYNALYSLMFADHHRLVPSYTNCRFMKDTMLRSSHHQQARVWYRYPLPNVSVQRCETVEIPIGGWISMDSMMQFLTHPGLTVIGNLLTIGVVFGYIYALYLAGKGILPVWYRLGRGLARRKIALFAESHFEDLQSMLVDSHLFKAQNVVRMTKGSIAKAQHMTLLLVHYQSFQDSIDDILRIKNDSDALIIYAPQDEGRIDDDVLKKINAQRNAIIVNFRGRLLNDILTSMMTTGYERR